MGRPKADPNQQARAYQLYGQGYGPKAIHAQLEEEFDSPVSLRTLSSWVQRFKEVPVHLYAPFEWHKMQELGLPWEASAYLLEMWAWYLDNMSGSPGDRRFHPSFRDVGWWWRVHLAAPELAMTDVWIVAYRFSFRETLQEGLGEPQGFDDLEAYLAYKPWQNNKRLGLYRRALENGWVRPIAGPESTSSMMRWLLVERGGFMDAPSVESSTYATHRAGNEYVGLLPSEAIKRARRVPKQGIKEEQA